MKITLESTTEIVELRSASGPGRCTECRVWKGHTETGIPVRALIALVAVERTEDTNAFERELVEKQPTESPRVFPLRLFLD